MLKLLLFLLLCGLSVQLVRALRGGRGHPGRGRDVNGRRSVEAEFEVLEDEAGPGPDVDRGGDRG